MKRFLAFLISLILVFSVSATNVYALPGGGGSGSGGKGSGNDDYYKAVSGMVRSHWRDDYFSRATLNVHDSTLKIDSRTVKLKNKVSDAQNELMIPGEALEALGAQVKKTSGGASIEKNGRQVEVTYGDKSMRVNGKQRSMRAAPKAQNGDAMLPESVLTEAGLGLGVDYNQSSGIITIKNDFQTMRVLTKVRAGASLPAGIRAAQTIAGPDGLFILQFGTVDEAKAACKALTASPGVVYAEPDGIVTVDEEPATASNEEPAATANGADAAEVVPLANYTHPFTSWGTERIGADAYMNYLIANGKQNAPVTVAVVDTGLTPANPCFAGRYVDGYNMIAGNADPTDDHGHGTHVAGTIVDITIAMPGVKIMPVKVLDSKGYGTEIEVANGIHWAVENGARVINMSLGGDPDQTLDDAVVYAVNNNVTNVVAAGNDADDTSQYSPARVDEAITVAAVDSGDSLASFTNFGGAVDIAAPGVGIVSADKAGGTESRSGTSMASPHVAGAVALLLCDDPSLTPSAVTAKIRACADDRGDTGFDIHYGAGVLNLGSSVYGDVAPDSIEVSTSTATRYYPADIAGSPIKVTAYYSDGIKLVIGNATFISSDPNVATVSDTGAPTTHGLGIAEITASYMGKSASINITVNAREITSIGTGISSIVTSIGKQNEFMIYAYFSNGSSQTIPKSDVKLTSDNPEIASIAWSDKYPGYNISYCVVTGVSAGTTFITIDYQGLSCTLPVTVLPGLVSMEATPDFIIVEKGSTAAITSVIATFSDGSSKDLLSDSHLSFFSDPAIADVSNSGIVTGLEAGSCRVLINYNTAGTYNKTIYVPVTVVESLADPLPQSISVSPSALELPVDQTGTLTVIGHYPDGSDRAVPANLVIWTTPNDVPGSAYWDTPATENGCTIKGLYPGVATISATYAGKTSTCAVTVGNPVVNAGNPKTVVYDGSAIELSGLFIIDPNAGAPTFTLEAGGTGVGAIGADGTTLTVAKAGTFTISLTTAPADTYLSGAKVTAALTVDRGTQTAPEGLGKADATTYGGSDGKITGLAAGKAYEYKKDGGGYTAVTSNGTGEITGLVAGSYVVRLPANDLYKASSDSAAVVIGQPDKPVLPPVTYYSLTVVSGTGSGNYVAGETADISANAAPEGQVFDRWTVTGGGSLTDANSPTTTFAMPSNDVTITAIFKPAGGNNNTGGNTGQKADTGGGAAPAPVTAIRSAQTTFYVVKGKSLTIPYAYDLAAGSATGAASAAKPVFTWTSSNDNYVSVSATGKVKGLAAGKSAKITVTADNGQSKTFTVKVVKTALKAVGVSVTKLPKTLKVGAAAVLKAKVSPGKATGAVAKFSLDKASKKVVSVDKAGKVTALAKGTARITIKEGGQKTVVTIKVV